MSDDLPLLSVLIIGYRMPQALANTLFSFSATYQRDVDPQEYEIVVIENRSEDCLPDTVVRSLPGNFRYILRENDSVSPIPAIEFGLAKCRGKFLGLIIDGAQMVTPGVLRHTLDVFAEEGGALVAVPGYHLGETEQHMVDDNELLHRRQREFLESIDWRNDGYRLFQWACFSPANRRGYLCPMTECNVLFCSRSLFDRVSPVDRRFQYPGGGGINLHIFRLLGIQRDTRLFVLPGEGTFHQYHGGVTTRQDQTMGEQLAKFNDQLQEIWDNNFTALRREPQLRGSVGVHARPFEKLSVQYADRRRLVAKARGKRLWEDDDPDSPTKFGRSQ